MYVAKMPFGKYRGRSLTDIPTDYLCWLINEGVCKTPGLKADVAGEYRRRMAPPPPPTPSTTIPDYARPFIKAGYHALVSAHHPDHGGSHDAMVELNSMAAALRKAGLL